MLRSVFNIRVSKWTFVHHRLVKQNCVNLTKFLEKYLFEYEGSRYSLIDFKVVLGNLKQVGNI